MAVELVNRDQFTRTAGLHPVSPYSRIVVLSLFTDAMGSNVDQEDSAVLGSRGVVERVEVHAHPQNINVVSDAVIFFGIGRLSEATEDGPVEFRQALLSVYGGSVNGLIIQSVEDYYDLRMRVQFIGDKTRLGAIVRSGSAFNIRYQVIFQISEG